MRNPLYDLIIGNVEGAEGQKEPSFPVSRFHRRQRWKHEVRGREHALVSNPCLHPTARKARRLRQLT